MADAWQVLDFTEFSGRVKVANSGLEVSNQNGTTYVPTADVAVVLFGVGTVLSAGVLHRLMSGGISVVFCDWKRVPIGAAYGWSQHGRVGARQKCQSELSVPRQKHAWQQVIKAKIQGQSNNLANWDLAGSRQVAALRSQVRSGDPANVEGRAARIVWSAIGGEGFLRQPGNRTGLNALLDYGYTVLRGHLVREVVAAGLLPSLGVFHRGRGNGFALVDDLIEPFRPCVDAAVLRMGVDADIGDPGVKAELVAASDQLMSNKAASVITEATNLARAFGQYVEGKLARLRVPVWEPACR